MVTSKLYTNKTQTKEGWYIFLLIPGHNNNNGNYSKLRPTQLDIYILALINRSRDHSKGIFPDSYVLECDIGCCSYLLIHTLPSESLSDVGERPNQPKCFMIAKHEYGKKTIAILQLA